MTSASMPYQVVYQNQLQFNLGVPLTTQNLAVQFNRPSPIFVERMGGQHGIPAKLVHKQATDVHKDSLSNYSTLSEDKMEVMSKLAKRDLRNGRLRAQVMSHRSHRSESLSPVSSPSRVQFHQNSSCQRLVRQDKTHKPLTAREAEKNRRLGAVQTPPPRRPVSYFKKEDSMISAKNTSMNITKDSDVFFPVKPIMPEGVSQPTTEVDKLQQEIEGYLLLIEHIGERAIAEPGARFLHPPIKGKGKDEFLVEDESSNRVRIRVEEQNTRLIRNLYNLKMKVKQLQRDAAHADLTKPTKKSQILAQLGIVHRGAVKALQTFVNQLPHQDLKQGLPSHYFELSLLLRQLTALTSLMKQGRETDRDKRLLSVLDKVDNLNAKWSLEQKKSNLGTDKKDKKPAVTKDWVSDTKVDRNIFVMKNIPEIQFPFEASKLVSHQPRQKHGPQMQRGRSKRPAVGKENRGVAPALGGGRDPNELRAAVATLLQPKVRDPGNNVKDHYTTGGTDWDLKMGRQSSQDHRKGYLLPHDLIVKREKAQRAVALANQERRFVDSTGEANLKKSLNRPSSAPANVSRQKGVNFDLNRQSPLPWVPPGRSSRSRSLSSEPKPHSRLPFYVRDMDTDDMGFMFPEKHPLMMKKAGSDLSEYENHSPVSDRRLRSVDVSNSFIDEVEHRLLRRLIGREAAENRKTSKKNATSCVSEKRGSLSADITREDLSDFDEPLETTDLDEVKREAASAMDAPTLENMKQRLAEMQREQREIRQRWSTMKFSDTKPRSRIFTSSVVQSETFRDPPAIEVTRMSKTERLGHREMSRSKEWDEEPLIFTKPSAKSKVNYLHTVDHTKLQSSLAGSSLAQGHHPKRLVTLKQTAIEKIVEDRNRIESYLRKRSHHPSGKFSPWQLVEEISDEILSDCLADVATEVEQISEEIANHMYKSEFVVDMSQPETFVHLEPVQKQPIGVCVTDSSTAAEQSLKKLPLHFTGNPEKARSPPEYERGDQNTRLFEFKSGYKQDVNTEKSSDFKSGYKHNINTEKPPELNSGYKHNINSKKPPESKGGYQPVNTEKPPELNRGYNPDMNADELAAERSLSTSESPDKFSLILSNAEPVFHNNPDPQAAGEELNEERGGGDLEKESDRKKEKEYEGDDNEGEVSKEESYESEDDEDNDEDEYEEDDFEDVSEDELK